MNEGITLIQLSEHDVLMRIDDGEEWSTVEEAFNRHYPERASMPFDTANYTQAEIDAVMVEFELKDTPAKQVGVAESASS